MKKFSLMIMSVVLLCFCTLFSACTPKNPASIKLSKTNATIYLGETENNEVSVNATLNNVDVKSLDLVYDTTYINVSQSKNQDGSFTIVVSSKISVGTNAIAVEVKAGKIASAIFYVDIVLPVERIVPKENLFVAYNKQETKFNLLNCITFEPAETKQTDVEFTLVEESENYSISGNILTIKEGLNLTNEQIKVNVESTVEGKSDVATQLNIKLIPNVKLLANSIQTLLDYNGEENIAVENKSYELSIEKKSTGFVLSTFKVKIAVPQALGLNVDIDLSIAPNILDYLSYSKMYTVDTANNLDMYTFAFESKSGGQGEGNLRFKFSYKDYPLVDELSSSFVGLDKQNNSLIESIKVVVTMPITGIEVQTDCLQNTSKEYILYKNYNNAYGQAFRFVALPEGTTQDKLILQKATDNLLLCDSKGNSLEFDDNNKCEIMSGDVIYIKGGDSIAETLKCYSATEGKESIFVEVNFSIVDGATALGFVDDNNSTATKEEISLNVEIDDKISAYIYAPGLEDIADFTYDTSVEIKSDVKKDYFVATFSANEIGKKSYTFATANGFIITAHINVIQPITSTLLKLKDNAEFVSGVGQYALDDETNDLINLSMENGYSAQLDFVVNPNAKISKVRYSFYMPEENDVYSEEFANLKNIKPEDYENINFEEISSILNTQSLIKYNLISTTFAGVNIIKIEIFGQSVKNGVLVDEIKATKFLFLQVYNPVKSIVSTAKNITLRASNQLSSSNQTLSSKTLSIDVLSDAEQTATYSKLFFDEGRYEAQLDEDGNTEIVCFTSFYDEGRQNELIKIVYNKRTKKLKIDALYVDEKSAGNYKLVLFAGDFINFDNGETIYSDRLDIPFVAYVININLIQTNYITDISVSNLTLVNEDETTKTYNTIYIDTSKSLSVTYKLFTQIEPAGAFEKGLVFNYTPNSGSTQAMLDIASDGTITVLGQQGGAGVITITPAYVPDDVKVKTVNIPIVVTDGNSWETAYEITSLDEIVDPNKHYVLTIPTTYTLTKSLFESVQGGFKGGLYGRRYLDDKIAVATIKLNNVSLFNVLASTAHIACLNICGDVNTTEYVNENQQSVKFTSRGFVANVSAGTIEDVKITTFVKNGIYVPSLLTIGADVNNVGGIVGYNSGTIKNCTFAGSINIENNNTATANAIAGTSEGNVENCNVIVAKFDSALYQQKRVLKSGENYINGVIGDDGAFKDIDGANVKENNYADYVFEGNVLINNYSQGELKFSYGDEVVAGYGLVFFYKAKQVAKQSKINGYNTILFDNLFAIKGSTSIEAKNLKVTALNLDGSVCTFISINPDNFVINGVGEFILKITSEFDYTKSFEIRMLSLYYASDFSISSNGLQINNASVLKIVHGRNHEIITRLNNRVVIDGEVINLEQNDFNVLFSMTDHNATDYITNNKLGSHTINMSFEWNEETDVVVQLQSGFSANFDTLLNKVFLTGENNTFKIQRKNGTTEISSSISEGAIEPKDTLTFVATLTTDLPETDEINNTSIYIFNEYNIDVSSNFTLFIEKLDLNNNNVLSDDFTFKISLSINQNLLKNSNSINLLKLVNKNYKILIKAKNGDTLYDSSCEVTFTLLPQTISNINTTLYNITSLSTKGFVVSNSETPTSVLIPSLQGGLFVIDMFPSYASYDYIEVVATANTMSKLSFRLQNKIDATSYSEATSGFEAILGQNGIRIFNTAQDDNQNIGTYYLKVFADASTFTDNTIFTITVTAFYDDEELPTKSIFSLHMRMPDAPQLSLNGQTKVYALAGQTISNITCLISNDQINPIASIEKIEGTNNSVVDGKNLSKIHVSMVLTSQNDVVGYKKYLITIKFDEDYKDDLDNNSTKFKLVVTSTKIANGNQILVSSEMNIYIVDYTVDGQDIVIFNAIENTFKVTSIKSQELKLAELIFGEINATQEFIDEFNEKYYFNINKEGTGFVFGSNTYDGQELKNKAEVLASYISYVNGNVKTPLLKVNASGNLEVVSTQYLTFDIEERQVFNPDGSAKKDDNGNDVFTQHLMVRGGSYTGTTSMILEIEYTLPDGRVFTYEYKFDIVNSQYTSEDLPKEISNADAFLGIENEKETQDYILTNDLYLYDFKTINNTDKISYLDGNNHTINIISFADDVNASNFALFNQISSGTTIKNLTVNLYHLRQIVVGETINANIAGFAIQNNGAIYNCEVLAYKNGNLATTSSTFGIKVDENVNVNVAGFVLNNNGSITNSRVGGTSKLITYIEYVKNDQDIVTNRIVKEIETPAQMFTIRASGTISGFVENNNGVIASCFVKNVKIQNTYFKQESMVTSGFVNTNGGTIALSYAEGAFENKTDAQAELGGLEGSGIMSGFVYVNSNKITDCYSNLKLTNTKEQVGRLGAGFVFENASGGAIERCYSASKVISNNITQMNFAGIKDFGGYNNQGTIKTSYYYIRNSADTIAIESILGTSINAVSDINNSKEFYGFSFKTDSSDGTWIMNNGPHLVSADDITHSVRAKYENPNKDKDGIDYTFVYCDGYELGSIYNPITIKNAQEFNSVFGASSSTSISDNNYSLFTKKIYGAYRIVNNINMLELVPEEEQETEYKVNLVSTKMTLSGEYTNTSNRNGSLNGNGLTISNLAISNASTTSDGFGLFKSIENGASICNINIEISSAGVSADHTVFVGTLAGTLKDSYAYNIDVRSENSTDYTLVIGANVTGGVFGRVVGDSRVSNISVKNISAISTNYTNHSFSTAATKNIYYRKANSYNDLSIAGGAFGVVDIYDKSNENDDVKFGKQDYVTPNVTNISVTGGMKIEGMTVGGLAGYIGNYVVARDLSLTILKNELGAYITAYNCFAGGIVGYNRGFLYQIKAEHEKAWQDEIESNIHAYYHATEETRKGMDSDGIRGNLNIFDAGAYRPFAIGGLIGYANGGKISVGYSKLNVINKGASYVGGLIGYVCEQETSGEEVTDNSKSSTLHEVYAVGDVYSELNSAYVGGLIGYNSDKEIKITKINAMNYWGHDSYLRLANERFSSTMNGFKGNALGGDDYSQALSIKSIKFEGEAEKVILEDSDSEVINSYYAYKGVLTDNGAQIDVMFKEKKWYVENNWSRDLTEMFPHILYIIPKNTYEIGNTDQFDKFILYGNDPNVTFIIIDSGIGDNLIDCSSYQTTLGLIRGNIIGATSKNGFKNLKVPLFTEAYGNDISNLTFKNCSSALVQTSNSVKYRDLVYKDCNFQSITKGNLGGVTQMAKGDTTFSNIQFSGCKIMPSSANNAGFLFGGNGEEASYSTIIINGVQVSESNEYKVISTLEKQAEVNYGLLFGTSTGEVIINSAKISDNVQVTLNGTETSNNTQEETPTIEANVGIIAGSANELTIDLSALSVRETDTGFIVGTNELAYKKPTTLKVGGIVGNVKTTLTLKTTTSATTPEGEGSGVQNNVSFAPTIKVEKVKNFNDLYLGTACGSATTLDADNNIYIFGQSKDKDNKTIYKTLNYDFAKNNYIGGIAGSVNSVKGAGVIAYYGDMIINAPEKDLTNKTYLNIGGLLGTTTPNATISNVLFDGTISFADEFYEKYKEKVDDNLFLRVGGVVGYNKGATLIKNSVVAGEIILSNDNGKLNLDKSKHNIAGVVGLNESSLTLGAKNENVIILTTIFSSAGSDGIDMIANNAGGSVDVSEDSSVKYCSSLTLAVTDKSTKENETDEERIINTSFDHLCTSTKDGEGNDVYENGIWEKIKGNTVIGSKLTPYKLGQDVLNKKDESDSPKNEYYYTESTLQGKSGKIYTYSSTYLRKLYLSIEVSHELEFQISLENTILFSMGASLNSDFTPIHKIDSQSAVSGLVVKIYIDESSDSVAKDFVNYAGLANINEGIIYTCSVQERLNSSGMASTKFYGYMNINFDDNSQVYDGDDVDHGVAGFVAKNTGFIFGSNCNVHLKSSDSEVKLNGFVGLNEGTISYCYASGINENNRDDLGSLFAGIKLNDKNEFDNGSFDHCYTIVMAKGTNISEKLPKNVFAEKDAVEKTDVANAVSEEKLLYKNAYFDGDPYYSCSDGYNYNYPTLSNGPFKYFAFLNRCTLVEYNASNLTYNEKNNTIAKGEKQYNITINGEEKEITGNDYFKNYLYFQIPNLTVLKQLGIDANLLNNHTKFIVISDINVGYDNPIVTNIIDKLSAPAGFVLDGYGRSLDNIKPTTSNLITAITATDSAIIKNLKFGGEITIGSTSGESSSGIIGSIGNNVTLSNIKFESGTKVKINTNLYNKESCIGVLVGTNGGIVENCKATYDITTNSGAKAGYILGGLVGLNAGTVTDCTFNGSVFIDENLTLGNDNSVTFGGIIGKNQGTATRLCLNISSGMNKLVFTEGGEIYKKAIFDELSYKDQQKDKQQNEINAQIFVRTSNKAIVGGIVGINSNQGKISMSQTYENSNSIQYAIYVGDEYKQMIAYAGGIVGIVTGGYVQDCSNLSNITAMSVWQFTTTQIDGSTTENLPKANYKIDDFGLAVECNNKTDFKSFVYYSDALEEPTLIYDDDKTIYVYREMTSLAFAGGIAGAGIKTASTDVSAGGDVNVRLANYGNIAGGFRAEKPIATIRSLANNELLQKLETQYWVSEGVTLATIVAWKVAQKWVVPGTLVDDIARAVALVSLAVALPVYFTSVNNLYDNISKPSVYVNMFLGNSQKYHTENNFITKMFNDSTEWGSKALDKINSVLGLNDTYPDSAILDKDYYTKASKFLGGGSGGVTMKVYHALNQHNEAIYPRIDSIGQVLSAFGLDFIKDYPHPIKIKEVTTLYKPSIEYERFDDITENGKRQLTLKNNTRYSYDGICPDINNTEQNIVVYSNVKDYTETGIDSVTLNSGNTENNKLIYKKPTGNNNPIYKYTSAYESAESADLGDWNDNANHPWTTQKSGLYVPKIKQGLELGTGDNPIQKVDGNYFYTLQNIDYWEVLVDTINKTPAYQSMQITVNLAGGETVIDVGDNTFDTFNGSIIFASTEFSFTNLVLTNGSTKGYGIIKETNGCTLKNIKVKGNALFTDSKNCNNNCSAGLLIGHVNVNNINNENSILNIDKTAIQADIQASNSAFSTISSMGIIVGSIHNSLLDEISKDSISITSCTIANANIYMFNNEIERTEDNYAFGGIIGSVFGNDNSNLSILLDKINTSAKITLLSHFNYIGGLIGQVGQNAKVSIGAQSNLKLNSSIMASSNRDIYVGGIVGCNEGTIVISTMLFIGSEKGVVISADVADYKYQAYAGGLLGYNANQIELNAAVSIGCYGTSYNEVSYIFAGFNLVQDGAILPSMANADYAIAKSTDTASFNGNDMFSYLNTIARHMYRETNITDENESTHYISWDGVIKGVGLTTTGSNNLDIYEGSTYQLYNVNSNYLSVTSKTKTNKTTIQVSDTQTETIESTYKFKESTDDVYVDLNVGEYILESTNQLGYKLTNLTNTVESSKLSKVIDYQWLLSINYKENIIQYTKTTSNIDVTYKFLISLTNTNAKLDDSGRYSIVVTQLNDYDVSFELLGYVLETTVDGDQSVESEIELSKKIYSEKEVNKVVLSRSILASDVSETLTIPFESEITPMLTSFVTEQIKEGNNLNQKTTSTTVNSDLKHSSFDFTFTKNQNSSLSFAVDEKLVLNITAEKTIASATTTEDSGDANIDSCQRFFGSKTFIQTRNLISISELPTGDSKNNTGVLVKDLTPEMVCKIMVNSNEIKKDGNSYSISENSMLNDEISLSYLKPTYQFNGKDYSYIQISTSEFIGQTYIFVTCMDEYSAVTEYVYKVNNASTQPTYCGNISYSLGSMKDFEALFNNVERYESMFPKVGEKPIFNVRDNLKNNTTPAPAPALTIYYQTYDSAVNIKSTAGDLFYTYEIVTTTQYKTITIGNTGSYTEAVEKDNTTTSGGEYKVYFIGTTGLGGLLEAKVATINTSSTAPGGVDEIENCKEYYTYNGNLVGYMKETETKDENGETIKITEYFYYRDGSAISNGSNGLSFYASTGEFVENKIDISVPSNS